MSAAVGDVGDRMALRALIDSYARSVDSRARADLIELFAPDAVFVQPPGLLRGEVEATTQGAKQIANAVLAAVAHLFATHHVVSQQTLRIDADIATGETYCAAHLIYGKAGSYRDYCLAIRYQDEFARHEGRWCITQREVVVDWFEDRTVSLLPG